MQGPPQVFETSIIQEVFRIYFQPHAQVLNAQHPYISQPVPVPMHKHAPEGRVHHGGELLSFLLQLGHMNMKLMHKDKSVRYTFNFEKLKMNWSSELVFGSFPMKAKKRENVLTG